MSRGITNKFVSTSIKDHSFWFKDLDSLTTKTKKVVNGSVYSSSVYIYTYNYDTQTLSGKSGDVKSVCQVVKDTVKRIHFKLI